ncbi:hypothetical protein [Clostridium sp.]|jgi:hypothetical protein|uniref:hypothetical protein n=1 Tax=Clostridium sp. TaxID=1506 RepID=UPI002590F0CB|nr:hypothetical protein [Clostridium sp.]MDF2502567.1 hypothetical protein [Clostridium sp.]
MLLERKKEYTIKEFLDLHEVHYKIDYNKLFRCISIALGIVLYSVNVIGAPTSGLGKLDGPLAKIVTVAQSVIFWGSMLYAFKSLAIMIVKGEGSWKSVANGGFICALDYIIPWVWDVIRVTFK